MEMTGLDREDAERTLSKSLLEMTSGPAFEPQSGGDEDYPRFLPDGDVKKCTVRVSLKGISPVIWRKFECPSNISLRHLTELISDLMGWSGGHLNHIMVGQRTFYVPSCQRDPDFGDFGNTLLQEDYKLSDLLVDKGQSVRWEYDFGDSWEHDIRLSSVDEYKPGEPRVIVFKGGRRACPPEDCGGIWGYGELLDLHARRKARKRLSSDEKERLEWYGIDKDFDPEEYDGNEGMEVCDYYNGMEEEAVPALPSSALPSSALYDDILALAFSIRELEPWEDLDDSDVYAVKMEDGSEVYVATMGNGGESFDVQLFDGAEEFQVYLNMTKGDSLPEFEMVETQCWAKFKAVMFQDCDDGVMAPAQYRHIRQWAKEHNVRINPAHGYPFLQFFRPHRYPVLPAADDPALPRFKEALQAVEWLSRKILDSESLSDLGFNLNRVYATEKGGKVVPLVVRTPDGYKVESTRLPGIVRCSPVILEQSDFLPVSRLPKSGAQYIRLMHLPGWVGSRNDQENSYSALTLLCVDKKDGYVSFTELCDFSDSYERDVLRRYVQKLRKEGAVPQRLYTDDPRTEAFLRDFCARMGIILELKRTRIPMLSQACERLFRMNDMPLPRDKNN